MNDTEARNAESMDSALVGAVAKRFLGRGVEYDELFQAGYVGVLLARRNYDSKRGVPFPAYAFSYIEGEIRKFIRNDRNIRLPRSIMKLAKSCAREGEDCNTASLPLNDAVGTCTEKNIKKEIIPFLNLFSTVSISEIEENYDNGIESINAKISGFEDDLVESMDLKIKMNRLNIMEKSVIILKYIHGNTQKEIGEMLEICQSTVSRYEKSALKKLRQHD